MIMEGWWRLHVAHAHRIRLLFHRVNSQRVCYAFPVDRDNEECLVENHRNPCRVTSSFIANEELVVVLVFIMHNGNALWH